MRENINKLEILVLKALNSVVQRFILIACKSHVQLNMQYLFIVNGLTVKLNMQHFYTS